MRWVVVLGLISCTANPPPRDPRDTARIDALEQRVAVLEAQLQKTAAQLQTVEDRPIPAPVIVETPPAPGPAPAPPRWTNPDPTKVYAVPLDDSPMMGPTAAPITIVAALQFPEPYTHRVWPTLVQLRGEYKRDLRIVVKLFVVHPRAITSSIAACATAYQNALDSIETSIWDAANDPTLQPTPQAGMRQLDELELRELARASRLDLRQYDKDFLACKAGLDRDKPVLAKLGQSGVPQFWINGRPLSGAQPVESFRKVIDEELVKAKADKAAGGKPATYYERITKGAPTSP
jgi:protein-disulfide isomerase